VELHALPEGEDPDRGILRVLPPRRGEPGAEIGRCVGAREVPEDQRLEDRVAEEAHALEPVVRHPGRRRDVGGGHRDAERALCAGGERRDECGRGEYCGDAAIHDRSPRGVGERRTLENGKLRATRPATFKRLSRKARAAGAHDRRASKPCIAFPALTKNVQPRLESP